MAKGKVEKKDGRSGAQEQEQEQKLQAILLADSFNTNFRPISSDMPKHKEKKKDDPLTIMTMCFKEVGTESSIRPIMDNLVVGMDKGTNQVVLYNNHMDVSRVDLATALMEEHTEIQLRSDLMDCNVDVCSPEVLVQISDNFDYQDIRQHFVANEAANHELGNKILAHMVPDTGSSISVKVEDFRLYHQVSLDIMGRWLYPLVPDNCTTGGVQTHYTYSRGCVYKGPRINLHRSVSRIGRGVVIGADVTIGEGSVIEGSVIGDGCFLGKGVTIRGSYVWAGARIEDGCSLDRAILASRSIASSTEERGGAIVRAGAVVPRGCVLGPDTILGKGVHLPEFTR
ncbi:unnamed protein product, partial [Discosporangium mesarthrocarpum]